MLSSRLTLFAELNGADLEYAGSCYWDVKLNVYIYDPDICMAAYTPSLYTLPVLHAQCSLVLGRFSLVLYRIRIIVVEA